MSFDLCQSGDFKIEHLPDNRVLKGTFVQCEHSDGYTFGIRSFKREYERLKPTFTLWDNSNFRYHIPQEERLWTDSFLNFPSMQLGFTEKVGIILSSETIGLDSILSLFDEGDADVPVRFFLQEQEAFQWFEQKKREIGTVPDLRSPKMNLSSLTGGKIKLNIEIEPENLSFYLKRISHALYTTENLRTKFRKFSLLTAQERKVLHLLVKGYYSKEIAQILYISIETVKTHRKNISKKLEAHSAAELSFYYAFL